jgi:LAGLIDADG DNA endonuclease family protein
MSNMAVRSHSVRHCRDNLWMRSDAGPLVSREFLSAYISGYADGEGCFTVSIAPRASLAVGWEVRPSFSVSQNGDRAEVLYALQAYFGCGSIRPDRSDRTLKWETRKLDKLVERVVASFHPISTAVREAARFRAVCVRLPADGRRRASKSCRSAEDRVDRSGYELGRSPTLQRGRAHRDPTS